MSIIKSINNIYGVEIISYDDYIYKHSIEMNKIWDEEIIDEILLNNKENYDILDIGANIGLITIGIIKKAKEQNKLLGTIHCFECNSSIIPLLISNVSQYNNVNVYTFALSDKQELCNTTLYEDNMGSNYIYSSKDDINVTEYDYSKLFYTPAHKRSNNVFILGVALDSIKYQFTNRIGIIKIDVEGYEFKVLEGAKELIKIHQPIIIAEIFETINFDKVIAYFNDIGYKKFKKIINREYNNEDYIFYP
jgi:FkbM family methyltransferase